MMAIAAPWMLSNLFVASLIAMTAWVVGRSGRHAWLAHGLWVMVLIKMVSPPIISVPIIPLAEFTRIFDPPTIDVNLDQPVTEVVKTFGSPVTEFIPETYAEILGEFRSDSHRFNGSRWIGCIWGLGAIIVLCVEASKMLRFRRLLASEGKFDPRATAFVDTLLAGGKLGSRRFHSPRVVRVPLRVSPMLFGLGWRPVIVCPDSLWRELPPRTRQAFLAHEAAHYSRGDHWIRGLEWIVRSVYWWFPPLRWVRGSIQRHEEVCCDRWAIDRLSLPPRRYAESLLSVVDFIADHEVGIPAMASGMRPTAELEERLRLMMRRGSLSSPSRKFKSIAIMIAIALLCIHPTVLASRLDNQTQELLVTDVNAFDDIKMATVAEVAEVAEVAAASPLEPMSSDLARDKSDAAGSARFLELGTTGSLGGPFVAAIRRAPYVHGNGGCRNRAGNLRSFAFSFTHPLCIWDDDRDDASRFDGANHRRRRSRQREALGYPSGNAGFVDRSTLRGNH